MRFHTVVHTVGDLLDAVDGLDPEAPVVWQHVTDLASGDQHEGTVDANPAAAFIKVHLPHPRWDEYEYGLGE